MPGGRPRKPTHLKVIAGTMRKHRENKAEPKPKGGWPASPEWLSDRATEIFDETCRKMSGLGTLSEEWQEAIADYASAREEIEITTAVLEDLGRIYTTTTQAGDTMYRPRPEVAMRSDAMRRAQALRAALGLDPASSSKVSAGTQDETNPFAALG